LIPQLEGLALPLHLRVPLPNGTSAPIPTLPPTSASLMPGVWFGTSSRGTKHILEMCRRGHIWADKLHARPLTHLEAWTSFSLQLYPGMVWGLSTVVLNLHELYEATRCVYFKILPLLGVQCHIELPWRTLPKAFQGIGLPNFALNYLAANLQLIQCTWGSNDATSIALSMAYGSFLIDLGLYRNSLGYNYDHFSILAKDNTWFKNVWELLNDFNVGATFGRDYQLHRICTDNQLLMALFSLHYSGPDLASLNIYCQHKKVIQVSCIVMCDGRSINKTVLTMSSGHLDFLKCLLQYPTWADHTLWKETLKKVSSDYYIVPQQLGCFVNLPYKNFTWRTSDDGTI
jgi:hypothetical protein